VTRVAIVAPTPVGRARLDALVGDSEVLTSTVAAASIDALAGDARLASSEVVLIHAAMDDLDLRDFDLLPPIPVVVLTRGQLDDDFAATLLARGIRGVLPDDSTAEEVEAATAAAAAGLVVLAPEQIAAVGRVRARGARREFGPRRLPAQHAVLTPREHEILGMLAEGLPNKAIAARLGISDHTVKTHIEAVFEKLGASTRAEAVARAVRSGTLLL
jgi:DNA-binding NarL/FixJ family response regulator